jgi:hypothetical protein
MCRSSLLVCLPKRQSLLPRAEAVSAAAPAVPVSTFVLELQAALPPLEIDPFTIWWTDRCFD